MVNPAHVQAVSSVFYHQKGRLKKIQFYYKLDGVGLLITDPPLTSFTTLCNKKNKANADSAKLLDLNWKVQLYNSVIVMTYIVILRKNSSQN